jgi:predicted AAA+ superfamily ATPase
VECATYSSGVAPVDGIRHADRLTRQLQLLALQLGKEVSLTELGRQLGMSKNTVERYLDLLQKVFVIYRVGGFSRNLCKEISKSQRYYFTDNGVRNAVIEMFNPLDLRADAGEIWENYVFSERLKRNEYLHRGIRMYFWRTYDRKEIDLVEEQAGRLNGYEIKWRRKNVQAPKDWTRHYPEAGFKVIHTENYLDFITAP